MSDISGRNAQDLTEIVSKLAGVVADLQLRVADLEDRLENAEIRHRANRTFPEPDVRLHIPQSKFKD
jgi:hypothetical protein